MDRDHRTKANRRKTWHAGHIVVMISPSASRTSCQANGIPCSFFVFFSLFFCFFFFFSFSFYYYDELWIQFRPVGQNIDLFH